MVCTKSIRKSADREPSAQNVPGESGTTDAANAELLGEHAGMRRARPAIGQDCEIADVDADPAFDLSYTDDQI
jgi:hypothetical protein